MSWGYFPSPHATYPRNYPHESVEVNGMRQPSSESPRSPSIHAVQAQGCPKRNTLDFTGTLWMVGRVGFTFWPLSPTPKGIADSWMSCYPQIYPQSGLERNGMRDPRANGACHIEVVGATPRKSRHLNRRNKDRDPCARTRVAEPTRLQEI